MMQMKYLCNFELKTTISLSDDTKSSSKMVGLKVKIYLEKKPKCQVGTLYTHITIRNIFASEEFFKIEFRTTVFFD